MLVVLHGQRYAVERVADPLQPVQRATEVVPGEIALEVLVRPFSGNEGTALDLAVLLHVLELACLLNGIVELLLDNVDGLGGTFDPLLVSLPDDVRDAPAVATLLPPDVATPRRLLEEVRAEIAEEVAEGKTSRRQVA